ncbi:MAG: hypothetical protein R2834_06975 [Rhodothermales bacterium]
MVRGTFLHRYLPALAVFAALAGAGCGEGPAPLDPLGGGVIAITFGADDRQVIEKGTITYHLQITAAQPIEWAVLEGEAIAPDTLEAASGLLRFVFGFQEEADVVGRRERRVRVRAGGEEEIASVFVDIVGRDRVPIRFAVYDMTDHRRRLVDGEICYVEVGDTAASCHAVEEDGAVNTAFPVGGTFDVFYRADGFTSYRQAVQRQEGAVVYDRPLFAGWDRPMRFTALDPLVVEGDRLTLYAMPDAFPAERFAAAVSGGDPDAPVNALPFPIEAATDTQTIPFAFYRPESPAADDAGRRVHPDVEPVIRQALADFAGLAGKLSIAFVMADRIDDDGATEAIRFVGDSAVAAPGVVEYNRSYQAAAVAAGQPAYATGLVYRTAGVPHPAPERFGLRPAQGALLRTLFPALSEDDFDAVAGDDGYRPLAVELVAVSYAYFGHPGLFKP